MILPGSFGLVQSQKDLLFPMTRIYPVDMYEWYGYSLGGDWLGPEKGWAPGAGGSIDGSLISGYVTGGVWGSSLMQSYGFAILGDVRDIMASPKYLYTTQFDANQFVYLPLDAPEYSQEHDVTRIEINGSWSGLTTGIGSSKLAQISDNAG